MPGKRVLTLTHSDLNINVVPAPGSTTMVLCDAMVVAINDAVPRWLNRAFVEYAQIRVDSSCNVELGYPIAVDVQILDAFDLDLMRQTLGRNAYDTWGERHRSGAMIIIRDRGPDKRLATIVGPVRVQYAIDCLTSPAYELVIVGESYRQ